MALPFPNTGDPKIDRNFLDLDKRNKEVIVRVVQGTSGLADHEADTTNIHGIADTSALVVDGDSAGGALDGTYPNPGLAASVAGNGLTESSNVLAVGAGSGIDVSADAVAVDPQDFNLSGTHAARPDPGTAGRTYFETDTHVLYRDSGSVWQALAPGYVRKTADQTLTQSSTTPQDVTDLSFPVETGEIWLVEAFLMVRAQATADWKFGWGGTATYDLRWAPWASSAVTFSNWNAVDTASTPPALRLLANTVSLGGQAGQESPVALTARVASVTVAGTVQLQAAQDTAGASDNIIRGGTTAEISGSQMRLTRLN